MVESNESTRLVIHSQLYGILEPEDKQLYQFEQGIIGFNNLNAFALLPYDDTELFVLQSIDGEISLMLIPAALTANGMSFNIDEATINLLGVKDASEIITFYVMRVIDHCPFVNMKAPILIVPERNKGCQYVIVDEQVGVREPLVLVDAGAESC